MSQETKKVVNIYPTMPVTRVTPPLRTVAKNVSRPISYIRACIMSRAMVDEVLPDGTTVRLGLHNYDKNNYVVTSTKTPAVDETAPVASTNEIEDTTLDSNVETEVTTEDTADEELTESSKSAWDIAYENALADKDLASMTKKQRKEAKAEARAIADAAVNGTTEDESAETTDSEETVDTTTTEDIVETNDAEDLSEVTE